MLSGCIGMYVSVPAPTTKNCFFVMMKGLGFCEWYRVSEDLGRPQT